MVVHGTPHVILVFIFIQLKGNLSRRGLIIRTKGFSIVSSPLLIHRIVKNMAERMNCV